MTIYYTDSEWTAFRLVATFALIFLAGFAFCKLIDAVYGDDTESDLGLCLRGYESHCISQKAHDLEGSLMIWNSANCSERDICTPQTCFANKELADLYIKEMGNDTGNVKVPCPPMQKQQQEDESGK